MLIFLFPVGIVLLWIYGDYTKKTKGVIIAVFLGLLVLSNIFGGAKNKDTKKQQSTTVNVKQEPLQENGNTPKINITKSDYFDLAQQEIAKAMSVPVVEMNMSDYWEMEQSTGLTITKGTFISNNTKHEFKVTFITENREPIGLYIDGQRIYWHEEKHDAAIDAKLAKDAQKSTKK